MSPEASIIVSTYNRPEALEAVLTSLNRQTRVDFEIVVADDGSTAATAAAVLRWQTRARVPIKHVWQPDEGFRLAAIRNHAIEASEADYLILTDGDCLFLPDAIARHLALAERGWFVTGKRSYLRQDPTDRILKTPGEAIPGSRAYWFGQALFNQCTRPFEFLVLPDWPWRKNRAKEWRKAQTCNLGVWRDDCLAVGGFDERYQGHGLEDSDFIVRLLRHGARRKRGDYALPVLHLNHSRPVERISRNRTLFKELLSSMRTQAVRGLVSGTRASKGTQGFNQG